MAFFKSFQQNLPSVNISSLLDSVSSRVDDLATAVSDVTYSASNQLSEQVTTIIGKVQEDGGGPDEDQAGGGEDAGPQEEGRTGRRAKRRTSILRDPEADQRTAGGGGTEGGGGAGDVQLEWEWRDGCWRVKRTQEELAEEGRRKDREREWEEDRERKRRERRERQMERQGKARTEKEEARDTIEKEVEEQEEEVKGQESKANGRPHNLEDSKQEEEDIPEEQVDEHGEAGDEEEECPASAAPTKKKKSGKNKSKDAKTKKKKNKKKGGKEEEASDSEEDRRPEPAVPQKTGSVWNNKHKQTNEEGYSSEASSGQTNSIQRIQRNSSLNELQPPPYQDKEVSKRASRSRPGRGVRRGSSPERCSSEASGDQDTESYLNKVYDEDAPSDSTAVLGPEDASGPRLPVLAYEPEPLAKYGTLDVAFEYDSGEQWLAVTVTAATDIPEPKQTGSMAWQVHLVLLPTKTQRAKTGVQKGPCPVFTETFKFSRLEQEALGEYAVRFRLYSVRRMKKEKVLGEKVFCLTKLKLQGKMALPVTLEPGTELTGCGSLVSVSRSAGAYSYRSTGDSSSPEILLGLTYNAATGHLSTEVIQGSHFKNTASDKPTSDLFCCVKHFIGGQLYIMRDTYVKLTLLDSKGKEMSKWKTSVCRGQPNPTYKETFVFQVALFQLSEVSLVVSVFCRRSSLKPRERIGWVSLGLDSTGEDQQTHWNQMREAEGQQVSHWHTLAADT